MSKKNCPFLFAIIIAALTSFNASAQVNLPYTLAFNSNSTAAWADGIAQDGDGGTLNINGIDILIYTANPTTFAVVPGSTIRWADNDYYFSGEANYTGLTSGPDPQVTLNGVQAMVIKSSNPANNFSLNNIRLYDWGGTVTTKIATYNDGTLVGSINVTFDQVNYNTTTLTTASGLTAAIFQNIDEIRFTPVSDTKFWLSFNNLGLSMLGVLPVNLSSFEAVAQTNGTAAIKWTTEQEVNTAWFTIEHSTNGTNFLPAGKVAAAGNRATPSSYNFNTEKLQAGNHFFRLKTTDINGTVSYSDIKNISIRSSGAISIYPNPVKDRATISAAGNIIRQVKLFNAAGSLLSVQKANSSNTTIDLSGMSRATYYVDVMTDKGTYREVLVKE